MNVTVTHAELMRAAHHVAVCERELEDCLICRGLLIDAPLPVGERILQLAQHLQNLIEIDDQQIHFDLDCETCNGELAQEERDLTSGC